MQDTDTQSRPNSEAGSFRLVIDARSARLLTVALTVAVGMLGSYAAALVLVAPEQRFRLPGVLVALAVSLATYRPLRQGDGRRAIEVLGYGTFLYIAVTALAGNGLRASILMALPLTIVIPGLLLGRRFVVRFTLLAVALCLVLTVGHLTGWIEDKKLLPPLFIAITMLGVLAVTCVMTFFTAGAHARRLARIQQLNGELLAAQQEFRTLADNLPALVMRAGMNLRCTYVNEQFLSFARLTQDQVVGQSLESIFTADQFAMVPATVQAALRGERVTLLAPHSQSGVAHIFELVVVRETDVEGQPVGLLALFYDVTEREQLAVELRRSATHDFLTGLANRMRVEAQLESALSRARRHQSMIALLVIDLDGFKPVNDTHGHAAGDHLLKQVADQMKGAVRDIDTVGRIGGDEFVAVIEELDNADAACAVAEKLLVAARVPVIYEDKILSVGASVGIALFPQHGESVRDLFQSADTAMYRAKGAGKNCFRLADDRATPDGK